MRRAAPSSCSAGASSPRGARSRRAPTTPTPSDGAATPAFATPAHATPALATARRAHDGVARVRVDVVAVVPGGDDLHLRASAAAGARAVVLEALGSGNASPAIVEGVRRCVDQGVRVAVTSRVPEGALAASYGGGGGGHDLVVAGAAMARTLRAGQTRILLAELLARGMADDAIAAALAA
ncbi:hypothetical protein QMO46_14900 [Microbacterium barkeri]|uniref:hypothetical protein n=1 Tax=Microbacterium barkeri TaxID=33917 RepID=UPI0024AF2E9C|nr:hypothetical protein [Microbacterium barkeri]MDI6944780.1 hypothetical protein [Microbacterium barkeri]